MKEVEVSTSLPFVGKGGMYGFYLLEMTVFVVFLWLNDLESWHFKIG